MVTGSVMGADSGSVAWGRGLQAPLRQTLDLVSAKRRNGIAPLVDRLRGDPQRTGEPCRSLKMLDGVQSLHGASVSILTLERQGC